MRNTVVALLFALLSSCASFVETRVSSFHELERPLSGVTYALIPSKEQEASLEFQSYAKLIKSELGKRGLIEAPFDKAKYAIFMFYGIDNENKSSRLIQYSGKLGSAVLIQLEP